jgi:putative ABC transport system substrate-binding protein
VCARLVIIGVLIWASLHASAHAADVAILKSADVSYYDEAVGGFRAALPPRTSIEEFNLHGNLQRGREVGKALRAESPRLVFAVGLKAALAAKLELPDVPVIFGLVLDPELHGLPSPNMTGIRMRIKPNQQLETLRTLLPTVRRIGVLYDQDRSEAFISEARRHAQPLGMEVIAVGVKGSSDVPDAVRALLPQIQAFWLIQDSTVVTDLSATFVVQSALDAKVPLFTFSSTLVQQGALGALVVQAWEVGQQAAYLSGLALRGQTIPSAQLVEPQRPQLTLNLHTADYLGVTLSSDAIRMASELFGPGALAKHPRTTDTKR